MAIVGGLDIHRRQITYDWIDTDSGETCRGQLSPATRVERRPWLARFPAQQADFALEATTGWRFVAQELERAGFGAHLAEPADTRARRGPKRHAKTDRTDARHLRERLRAGTLPESWMPPAHIADARTQLRLRRALVGERTGWYQRIHAILFHHGPPERSQLLTADGRAWLASIHLPAVARQAVEVALGMIDHLKVELDTSTPSGRHRPGPARLPSAPAAPWGRLADRGGDLAEFGDVRRFTGSRQAVRCCAWTSPSPSRTASAPAAIWPALAPPTTPPTSRSNSAWWQAGRAVGGPQARPRGLPHLRELGDQALVPADLPPPPEQVGILRTRAPESLLWCGQLPDAPVATRRVIRTGGRPP